MDKLALLSSCFPCLPNFSSPYLSINDHKYKIIKLLGEGGFSYVYLVSQTSTNGLFALKRIKCPFGSNDEIFKHSLEEIKNYHRFSNSKTPYIIQSIDEAIIQESDGSKTIHILLPYFEKSLQDIINSNVLNNKLMEEEEILTIFIGICRGLQVMHKYKKTGHSTNLNDDSQQENDLLLGNQSEDDQQLEESGVELDELFPYAHRDIKPANVMLSAEGIPVLVDLGSCSKARILIKNRQQGLTLMDFASEHCTLPYRAPELFDIATNSEITEKTDIWSLGCLLYSCCFGFSPFEKLELDQGANLTVAITTGRYDIPRDSKYDYSEQLITIIQSCLKLNPTERPSIEQLLESALELSRNG